MFTYFFIFFVFLFSCGLYIFFSESSKDSKRFSTTSSSFFLAVPFFVLIFLLGFRYEVGTDYWNYVGIFERFESKSLFVMERFEPGFLFLLDLVSSVGLGANHFLFVAYLLTMVFFWAGIKELKFGSATMASLAVILFLGLGPVFSATNLVRQSLALSIVFYLCIKFKERKFTGTLSSAFFGSLFHYSAPIVLLFNFIPRKILGFKFWFFAVLISIFFSNFAFDRVLTFLQSNAPAFGMYSVYFQGDASLSGSTGLGIRVLVEVFIFLLLSIFIKKIDRSAVWFFNIAFFGVILSYIFRDYAIFLRVAAYFDVFKFVAIPWFLAAFSGARKYTFFLFFVIYAFAAFSRSATTDQFSPYMLVFFK